MDDLHTFYLLKQKILAKYVQGYPYYSGSIHNFGNREIAQLIDLIEKDTHARVSEKWVYTHLKPVENIKLPRKDMLDIFSKWLGYDGWDAFIFQNKKEEIITEAPTLKLLHKQKNKIALYTTTGIFIAIAAIVIGFNTADKSIMICLKDKYTQKAIDPGKAMLYELKEGKKRKLPQQGNCFKLTYNNATVIAESAYYKADTLHITDDINSNEIEFELQPDDYAMMLRAYMNGNVADWNKRRTQLGMIISNDAVIQEIMFDEIGVEFLNKSEFINKITTPGTMAKNMEVVEIKYEGGKIISLKFIHKGK